MPRYPISSTLSSKELFADTITGLIESVSAELNLSSADIKEVLDRLASRSWAEEYDDDRQLSLPFGDTLLQSSNERS
jgi:hypothetical protein